MVGKGGGVLASKVMDGIDRNSQVKLILYSYVSDTLRVYI